ncbi:MAG: polyamine aminopropyltransferase [Halobacteria archaeon]
MTNNNNTDEAMGLWQSEWISKDILEFYRVSKIIYLGKTKYQKITVIETLPYGKCLLLDDKMQSSLKDEYIYHETLVHPALSMHGNPKRVVVVGGGECATIREVAKWSSVDEIIMVELDKEVIEITSKYLGELGHGVLDDPRLRLVIEEGRKWLSEQPNKSIDVLIIDVTDPLEGGPSYLLFTREFYQLASQKLKDDGVLATQATSPVHNEFVYDSIKKTLASIFKYVIPLHAFIKSYSSIWGFLFASNKNILEIAPDTIKERLRVNGVSDLKFYAADMHFSLKCIAEKYECLISSTGRIIEDNSPIFVK